MWQNLQIAPHSVTIEASVPQESLSTTLCLGTIGSLKHDQSLNSRRLKFSVKFHVFLFNLAPEFESIAGCSVNGITKAQLSQLVK